MESMIQIHKESPLRIVHGLWDVVTAYKTRVARLAREQEADAARAAAVAPRHYLTPR